MRLAPPFVSQWLDGKTAGNSRQSGDLIETLIRARGGSVRIAGRACSSAYDHKRLPGWRRETVAVFDAVISARDTWPRKHGLAASIEGGACTIVGTGIIRAGPKHRFPTVRLSVAVAIRTGALPAGRPAVLPTRAPVRAKVVIAVHVNDFERWAAAIRGERPGRDVIVVEVVDGISVGVAPW